MIEFTKAEVELMTSLSVAGGWDNPLAAAVTEKIRDFLRHEEIKFCCYCRVSMHGWHNWTIDPEHILPKQKYPKHQFTLVNLNISCKRCNMGIKLADNSFFLAAIDCAEPFKSELYTFIHPNLDHADDHLHVKIEQSNAAYIRKYWVVNNSAKGRATYEYFRLSELEVPSIDEAQGMPSVAPDMRPDVADKLTTLLKQQ